MSKFQIEITSRLCGIVQVPDLRNAGGDEAWYLFVKYCLKDARHNVHARRILGSLLMGERNNVPSNTTQEGGPLFLFLFLFRCPGKNANDSISTPRTTPYRSLFSPPPVPISSHWLRWRRARKENNPLRTRSTFAVRIERGGIVLCREAVQRLLVMEGFPFWKGWGSRSPEGLTHAFFIIDEIGFEVGHSGVVAHPFDGHGVAFEPA